MNETLVVIVLTLSFVVLGVASGAGLFDRAD